MTRPRGHPECQFHLLRAPSEFEVPGPGLHTTVPMHRKVFDHPRFHRGDIATDFPERHLAL